MCKFSTALLLGLMSSIAWAQMPPGSPPEVDTAEVLRRGDDVTVAGEGPRSGDDELLRKALSPPEDDSGAWQLTFLAMQNCPHCDKLKADFLKAPLLGFVSAPEKAKAWAHFQTYMAEDTTQRKKIAEFRFKGYPTIVLQPPRNGKIVLGEGVVLDVNPNAVVWQETGYDGKPEALAARLRAAVKRFVSSNSHRNAKLSQESFHFAGGARQYAPPPGMEVWSDPFPPTDPSMPDQYPRQVIVPQGTSTLIVMILTLLGAAGFAGLIFGVWAIGRTIAKSMGRTPLLTDEQFNKLRNDVLASLNQNPTPNPAAPINRVGS